MHGLFVQNAVMNEIGNGSDLEPVGLRHLFQVRPARHGAVVVENLHQHRGGLESGEPCQIASRLGVSGAGEHAAGLRDQRKDVSRLDEVGGAGVR